MRRVAEYEFTHLADDNPSARSLFDGVVSMAHEWLVAKGIGHDQIGQRDQVVEYRDGRSAALSCSFRTADVGDLTSIDLVEPRQEGTGEFRTALEIAIEHCTVVVACVLEVGHSSPSIAPLVYDAKCPHVLARTASRLMDSVPSTKVAADRICRVLRRKIMGVPAFASRRSPVFDRVRRAARHQEIARHSKQATDLADYQKLAEDYAAANEALEEENDVLRGEVSRLDQVVANLELAHAYVSQQSGDSDSLSEENTVPPATVAEAVERAKVDYSDDLVFGDSVESGIEELYSTAGPPDKILLWLAQLATLSRAKRQGDLGKDMITWLKDHGVTASGESPTIRKNATEKKKRTWDFGNDTRQVFELHAKVSDGVSRDKCVRIYFDWCDERKQLVIGWVGPHP